jgi:hypothetical protein
MSRLDRAFCDISCQTRRAGRRSRDGKRRRR